jgi:general secretion pathway protein A
MYLLYYNLTEKPFQINTDPKFLWQGEKHKEALAMLKYGILDNRGFLFLAGDVGTGKTTLINTLTNQLGDQIIVAIVPDPGLEKIDFFNFVAAAFNFNRQFNSKGEFLVYFSRFLHKAYLNNKRVLLIIDESQRLTNELLEEIRLLSNIEKHDAKLINIFFVGQNEFIDILLRAENRALRQRITINYRIDPLTENETEQYIRHRLKVAGSQKNIFTSKAVHEIFAFSGGYPRLINIVCDHSLLTGYVKGKKAIDAGIIEECAKELKISPQTLKEKAIKPETIKPEATETKQEGRQKKGVGNKRKIAGYICLLFLVLFIAGHVHYSYDTKVMLVKQILKISDEPVQIQEQTLQQPEKPVQKQEETLQQPEKPVQIQEQTLQSDTKEKTSIKIAGQKENPQVSLLPDQKLIIPFGYDSIELSSDVFEKLDLIASAMISNPDVRIVVRGYAGKFGGSIYNTKLSRFRANVVKSYLAARGVSPHKIKTLGMGPATQIKTGGIEKNEIPDRRVEIELDFTTEHTEATEKNQTGLQD